MTCAANFRQEFSMLPFLRQRNASLLKGQNKETGFVTLVQQENSRRPGQQMQNTTDRRLTSVRMERSTSSFLNNAANVALLMKLSWI